MLGEYLKRERASFHSRRASVIRSFIISSGKQVFFLVGKQTVTETQNRKREQQHDCRRPVLRRQMKASRVVGEGDSGKVEREGGMGEAHVERHTGVRQRV